jgi:hypothetical protein
MRVIRHDLVMPFFAKSSGAVLKTTALGIAALRTGSTKSFRAILSRHRARYLAYARRGLKTSYWNTS